MPDRCRRSRPSRPRTFPPCRAGDAAPPVARLQDLADAGHRRALYDQVKGEAHGQPLLVRRQASDQAQQVVPQWSCKIGKRRLGLTRQSRLAIVQGRAVGPRQVENHGDLGPPVNRVLGRGGKEGIAALPQGGKVRVRHVVGDFRIKRGPPSRGEKVGAGRSDQIVHVASPCVPVARPAGAGRRSGNEASRTGSAGKSAVRIGQVEALSLPNNILPKIDGGEGGTRTPDPAIMSRVL